jgi:hypothetical protein
LSQAQGDSHVLKKGKEKKIMDLTEETHLAVFLHPPPIPATKSSRQNFLKKGVLQKYSRMTFSGIK